MGKKVVSRKVKKIPVILTILLFSVVFIMLFLLYKESEKKNKYKDNVKKYIQLVNKSIKNSIYDYESKYSLYQNLLYSLDDKESLIIDFKGDFPKLGSELTIKENVVVSANIYIENYKVIYKNSKLSIKYSKNKQTNKEVLEELLSKLEKKDKVSSIEYKIIEIGLKSNKDSNLESRLEKLKDHISYSIGEEIKYNPIENKICENGDDCYTFNIIKETDDKVLMLLNKNLNNSNTAWYENTNDNSKGNQTANKTLKTITNNWKVDSRLLSYEEALDLGCSSKKESCPIWLYQNLNGVRGFWTSSSRNNRTSAWYISNNGSIRSYSVNSDLFIIRPVVEIDKSILR